MDRAIKHGTCRHAKCRDFQLTGQVQALAEKYAVTYSQVANEIKTTEQELADMMGELTGNEFDQQGLAELTSLLKGA